MCLMMFLFEFFFVFWCLCVVVFGVGGFWGHCLPRCHDLLWQTDRRPVDLLIVGRFLGVFVWNLFLFSVSVLDFF